jgi:hypothetical protein
VLGAGLEALPFTFHAGLRHDRQHPGQRAVDSGGIRLELRAAAGVEAQPEAGAARGAVQPLDGAGVERRAVVREQQGTQALAYVYGAAQVALGDGLVGIHQPAACEPIAEVAGGAQVVQPVVDVEGVYEVPDELQVAGGLLEVWLDFLYHAIPSLDVIRVR